MTNHKWSARLSPWLGLKLSGSSRIESWAAPLLTENGHDSKNLIRMMSRSGAQDCGMNSGHALKLITELQAEDGNTTYHVLK